MFCLFIVYRSVGEKISEDPILLFHYIFIMGKVQKPVSYSDLKVLIFVKIFEFQLVTQSRLGLKTPLLNKSIALTPLSPPHPNPLVHYIQYSSLSPHKIAH
jgi:hypothetical protein